MTLSNDEAKEPSTNASEDAESSETPAEIPADIPAVEIQKDKKTKDAPSVAASGEEIVVEEAAVEVEATPVEASGDSAPDAEVSEAEPTEAEAKVEPKATDEAKVEPKAEAKATDETKAEPKAEAKATDETKPAVEEKPTEQTKATLDEKPSVELAGEVEVSAEAEVKPEATGEAEEEPLEEAPTDPAIAEALEKSAKPKPKLKPGKRIKVKLVQIGEQDCFVDYGGRSEGSIATSELKDDKGELTRKEGDEFSLVVKKAGDTVVFTLGKRRQPANLPKVKEAFDNGTPILGKIKGTNKGGFEVDLSGVRAFCPFSQIQLGYCDKPEEYVGQKLPFHVLTLERAGRNIVVSRRKILEADGKAAADETRQKLELGAVFEGVVRRLQPYGAFIDIGGVDGLVHVSEISHRRLHDPKEALEVGQKVNVKVIRIESGDKERISLSIKDLEGDPWGTIDDVAKEGTAIKGKVVRLADFGAFVEIVPGVDGLIHVSEISTQRIHHPSEALERGQDVEARVIKVDHDQRRISLSLLTEEESAAASHGRAPRDNYDDRPMKSPPKERKPDGPDVTKMSYEEALEALDRKFKGMG